MDSLKLYGSAVALSALLVACSGGGVPSSPTSSPRPMSEDERGSVGVPATAAEYCTRLGYELVGSDCKFADGTRCDEWAFFRGECGQAHSYCNQHGGTVSSKTVDMGSYTAVYGVCDVNGKQCKEEAFMQTGKCE